jgi:cystathionine beta-lyase/cystathionine gamma-synthase
MQTHELSERRSVHRKSPKPGWSPQAVTLRGVVSPAVFHGSTVLYPTAGDLHAHRAESYARHGSPATRALQDVLMSLEGPQMRRRRPCAVGLAAIATTLLSVPSAGDHGLVTDNVYRPSRTRRPKAIPATRSGSATSPARPACSASC